MREMTPRYPEAGINGLFLQSDQRRYQLSIREKRRIPDIRPDHSPADRLPFNPSVIIRSRAGSTTRHSRRSQDRRLPIW